MDNSIIVSIILGVASIISSIFYGYLPAKRKDKIARLEKKVLTLAKDLNSLLEIEDELCNELSKATGENAMTIKKDFRKKVSSQTGYPLSCMAKPSEMKRLIDKYNSLL